MDIDLSDRALRRWARKKDQEMVVGRAGLLHDCPICLYLAERFGAQYCNVGLESITVKFTSQRQDRIVMDDFLAAVVRGIDSIAEYGGPITAKEFLGVLDAIRDHPLRAMASNLYDLETNVKLVPPWEMRLLVESEKRERHT